VRKQFESNPLFHPSLRRDQKPGRIGFVNEVITIYDFTGSYESVLRLFVITEPEFVIGLEWGVKRPAMN